MRKEWVILGAIVAVAVSLSPRMLAPVRGVITSRFGEQRGDKEHNGTDVAVPVGEPVLASGPGVVVASTYTDRGGNTIIVKLDNGYTVGLAHLSQRLVKSGVRVERADVIGKSGNTGNSTGPHVHVTLRNTLDQYVDPEKYFNFA